jgi:hypothetical protein
MSGIALFVLHGGYSFMWLYFPYDAEKCLMIPILLLCIALLVLVEMCEDG